MWTVNNPTGQPSSVDGGRLYYLDHLKLLLITLVVLLHAAQPYGPADWWYFESQAQIPLLSDATLVAGTFLMSLFFLISAYLVPAAYDRKGAKAFLGDRFRRFLPLVLVGFLVLVPVLMYAYYLNFRPHPGLGFAAYYADVYMGGAEQPRGWSGPSWPDRQFAHLWFIQHLLVYAVLYTLWRVVAARLRGPADSSPTDAARAPSTAAILLFTVLVALATFALRIWYPVDTWVPLLEFIQAEPADLAMQSSFFVAGLLAYRQGWFRAFPARAGYAWLASGAVLAGAHLAFGTRLGEWYAGGGWNTGSLLWSTVETVMCVSLSIGLLVLFRRWTARPSRLPLAMAGLAFTVYLLHVPVVVALQYTAGALTEDPWQGFALSAGAGLVLSFVLAWCVSRTPYLRRVL
ncbi:acyltransferase family protein [Nocardiopsis alborubida]|uniref:Acyltransferase family protein n=1 Tax=Nocardiopsis alborubida TaxID=146802 RepID=A0A7X6RPC1_9ACTN|nr:acyltransferase family protein [Nocardiopsis alborubida]NKY97042.1 acyltransferase family protein [Nocardiopsis alborubida]